MKMCLTASEIKTQQTLCEKLLILPGYQSDGSLPAFHADVTALEHIYPIRPDWTRLQGTACAHRGRGSSALAALFTHALAQQTHHLTNKRHHKHPGRMGQSH